MIRFRTIILAHLVLLSGVGLLIYTAKSDLEVSATVQVHAVADFYDPLAASGAWVDVGSYGRCWHPRGVAVDWRPYCDGEWEWTDDGWFWETDEPWGWACYHYGTWVDDPSAGWCWVPGIEWAPAWVVWRAGGDYVGWAPCAPGGVAAAPGFFVFINANHFGSPVTRAAVVINNDTVFRQTSSVGGTKRESRDIGGHSQNVVINNGPDLATVEKASGHKFSPVAIQDAVRKAPAPANFRPSASGTQPAADQRPAVQPDSSPSVAPRNDERGVQPSPRPTEERPAVPSPDVRPAPLPEHSVVPSPDIKPVPKPELPASPARGDRPVVNPPAREDRPASPPREERPPEAPREERPPSPPPPPDNQRGGQGALPVRNHLLWAELRFDPHVFAV